MFRPCKTLIATAVISLFSGSIAAQESNKETSLPAITVTGTSILPSSIENLPGSYAVMTREQIEARNPFSIIETIREIPGLHVVAEDVAGTHLNIGLRGLNPRRSSRTLLLEDGAPTVFFAPYGDPSSHYSTPIERIERIEVLKGSGQILYGPQTMGGMINFVTRPVPTNGTAGSVKITGGNNGYYDGHFNVGSGTENGGFMIDVLKKRGDGIRAEHQFDLQDVALKGQYKINRDQRITGKYSNFQEDSLFSETGLTASEYLVSPYRGAQFDTSTGANQERFTMKRNTAQVIHEWDLNADMKLSTQLYYSRTDRASRRSREFEIDTPANGTGSLETDAFAVRPRKYEFFGIEPKLELKHNSFGLQNQAIFGFRYHEEDIDRKKYTGTTNIYDTNVADERLTAKIKALSYYAQNTFFAGDWSFTPGLRLEDVSSRKVLYGSDFSASVSTLTTSKFQALPGFGFTWNGLKAATVFGGIHKGFAPPRPDRDIGGVGGATLQRVTPELSTTTEVGIRATVLQSGYVESTLFNMNISDIVVQANNIFRNEGKAQHTGFEVAGKINLGELVGKKNNYFASLAYTNLFTAKFKSSGEVGGEGEDGYGSYAAGNRLPYAPKHTLALNFSYEDQQGFIGRVGVTHISKQFANTDNFRGTSPAGYCPLGVTADCGLYGEIPSLTLVNASVSYSPKGQKVTYFLSGENLSDKKYFSARTNGLQPGRGRMIFAGARYSF